MVESLFGSRRGQDYQEGKGQGAPTGPEESREESMPKRILLFLISNWPTTKLPEDYWHTFVYVNFGWLCCQNCESQPDIEGAWEGVGPGEAGIELFAVRAVEQLKQDGWQ